jgi:hypothetical protein
MNLVQNKNTQKFYAAKKFFQKHIVFFLTSSLVETATTNVAHPFDDIMIGIVELGFEHFQIANLEGDNKNVRSNECRTKRFGALSLRVPKHNSVGIST